MGIGEAKNQKDILLEQKVKNPIDCIESTIPEWNFDNIG
jgi:hypothetical protein